MIKLIGTFWYFPCFDWVIDNPDDNIEPEFDDNHDDNDNSIDPNEDNEQDCCFVF